MPSILHSSRFHASVGLLIAAVAFSAACASRRLQSSFEVMRAEPHYIVRAPDLTDVPFPDVLSRNRNLGSGWVDIGPDMSLRVEAAYYREGTTVRNLTNYLGTEATEYKVGRTGKLRQDSLRLLKQRPPAQLSVEHLPQKAHRRFGHHRFFYQVVMSRLSNESSAVLLSADSAEELDRLATQLVANPELVCGQRSKKCTVFPESCSASVGMEIVVNQKARTIIWGSSLVSVVAQSTPAKLYRLHNGRLAPVKFDTGDPQALRLPLLPGDHVVLQ